MPSYKTHIYDAFFYVSGVLALISIIRTIITPPGSIPDEREWDISSESNTEYNSDRSG